MTTILLFHTLKAEHQRRQALKKLTKNDLFSNGFDQ